MTKSSADKELLHIGDFLAKIAEKSHHVYWLSSPDLKKIIYVSPAYEKIWGRSTEELLKNPALWDLFLHPDDRRDRHPISDLAERVKSEGAAARFEENYRIIRPDGEIRWILDRGFPIFTDKGEICGITGVAIDVSKEHQAEEYLSKAKAAAETANQAKTKLLSNISHELRTPLNGILGLTEILSNHSLQKNCHTMVQDINTLANHLLLLVNDILTITTIETGNLKLVYNPVEIKDVVENTIELMKYKLANKTITFHVEFDKNVPRTIEVDQARFRQILVNIIDNAIKFTEKGHIKTVVSADIQSAGHCVLQVSVSDTGIGILPEFLSKIFKRFSQVNEKCYIKDYGGVGLGLSICEELLDLMDGKLSVTSKINEGSTFTFTIPTKYVTSPNKNGQLPKEDNTSTKHHTRILLVEDEPINLKVMELMLKDINCSYDIATTGNEAFTFGKTNEYDVILMDIQLPDINGVEVTRKLRTAGVTTPIIATTAHAFPEERQNFIDAGMNEVLTKPFRQQQIFDAIASVRKHDKANSE